jgi:hypothetical protein
VVRTVEHDVHLRGLRIEDEQAEPVIGDEKPSVLMDLQSVRFAIPFSEHFPLARGRDAKDAAIRNVGDVEIAFTVEGGSFEK